MTFTNLKRVLLRTILGKDVMAPGRQKRSPRNQIIPYQIVELPCHGCAHSSSGSPYPGRPSGERPCMFCVRNPNQETDLKLVQRRSPGFVSPRYDNKPVSTIPADQYIATDRLMRDAPEEFHIVT